MTKHKYLALLVAFMCSKAFAQSDDLTYHVTEIRQQAAWNEPVQVHYTFNNEQFDVKSTLQLVIDQPRIAYNANFSSTSDMDMQIKTKFCKPVKGRVYVALKNSNSQPTPQT